jgi:hypothetical protein
MSPQERVMIKKQKYKKTGRKENKKKPNQVEIMRAKEEKKRCQKNDRTKTSIIEGWRIVIMWYPFLF